MEASDLKKEFDGREFPQTYNSYYKYIKIMYLLYNYGNILRKYSIFNQIPHLDYIIELTPSQMPVLYIYEINNVKKEIIPNINQNDKFDNNHIDTIFERITKSELLGCFAKVNSSLIKELKDNGFKEYIYTLIDGSVKVIKVDDLLDKKVIFMCPSNIKDFYNNLNLLSEEELSEYINKEIDISESTDELLKNGIDDLFKIVFFHEYGHCAFYEINNDIKKKYNSTRIRERQANYYSSIILNGRYDFLIEIMNNFIGKQYKNPLLMSHEYTKGIKAFSEEERELYE